MRAYRLRHAPNLSIDSEFYTELVVPAPMSYFRKPRSTDDCQNRQSSREYELRRAVPVTSKEAIPAWGLDL